MFRPYLLVHHSLILHRGGAEGQLNIQSMLSEVLAEILAASLQQSVASAPEPSRKPPGHDRLFDRPTTSTHLEGVSSGDSESGEDYPEEMEFSEDEGLLPEQPAFMGLFRPLIFKSLIHKAKVTTKFGLAPATPEGVPSLQPLHDPLFQMTKPDKDVIQCPPLFAEVGRVDCLSRTL